MGEPAASLLTAVIRTLKQQLKGAEGAKPRSGMTQAVFGKQTPQQIANSNSYGSSSDKKNPKSKQKRPSNISYNVGGFTKFDFPRFPPEPKAKRAEIRAGNRIWANQQVSCKTAVIRTLKQQLKGTKPAG